MGTTSSFISVEVGRQLVELFRECLVGRATSIGPPVLTQFKDRRAFVSDDAQDEWRSSSPTIEPSPLRIMIALMTQLTPIRIRPVHANVHVPALDSQHRSISRTPGYQRWLTRTCLRRHHLPVNIEDHPSVDCPNRRQLHVAGPRVFIAFW